MGLKTGKNTDDEIRDGVLADSTKFNGADIALIKTETDKISAIINERLVTSNNSPSLVAEDETFQFTVTVIDNDTGPIALANITAGTYDLHRIRAGVETTIVADVAFSKLVGLIYADIAFATADWDPDDAYLILPNFDTTVVIGSTTYYVPMTGWSGLVHNLTNIEGKIDEIPAETGTKTFNATALASILSEVEKALEDTGQVMVITTIATLADQTSFTLTAGSANDDAYNGMVAVIENASTAAQKAIGVISNYAGATKTITLREDPGIFTMAAADKISIIAVSPDILNILADTNELQSDWKNGGRLDSLVDAIKVETDKNKIFAETGTDTHLTIANAANEITIKTFDKATYGTGEIKAFKVDLDKAASGFQTLAAAASTIKLRVYEKIDASNYRLRTDDGATYTWTDGVAGDKVAEIDEISFSEDMQIRAVLSVAPTGTINLPWLCELNKNMEV